MKRYLQLVMLLMLVIVASGVSAAPLKVTVSEVRTLGGANRDEMATILKTLIASRLSRDGVMAVGTVAEADVAIMVSYIAAGKLFSLDAQALQGGKTVARAFEQGEGEDDLIPATGRLADRLLADLTKNRASAAAPQQQVGVQGAQNGELVKIDDKTMGTNGSWRSPEIPTAIGLIAAGSVGTDGGRDIFLADNRRLFHYRKGTAFKLIAEKTLLVYEKILSLDVLETGNNTLDLYVTVVRNDQPASQIWCLKGDSLERVAQELPYFMRVLKLPGQPGRLYVQKNGGRQLFGGAISEAELVGGQLRTKQELPVPPGTSLYAFNQLTDQNGALLTVVLSPENKLVVYNREQKEIWRSSEEYGGSELFVEKREALAGQDAADAELYLNQKIRTSASGQLFIGKNVAPLLFGKRGNYKNGAVYCLAWSGDGLEGKWHTRITDYYLPDFFYDDSSKDLLQIEVTGRPTILSKGNSALIIRKIE